LLQFTLTNFEKKKNVINLYFQTGIQDFLFLKVSQCKLEQKETIYTILKSPPIKICSENTAYMYIFQAKYVRNKKINDNKLVGSTTTWGTIWGPVYEHLWDNLVEIMHKSLIIVFYFCFPQSTKLSILLLFCHLPVSRNRYHFILNGFQTLVTSWKQSSLTLICH
jgi:hypothetical protein